ncbi:MAG: spore germination protein [Bacillota bacterium]|nr:spore germination protein [Bacillota bacterium]
MKEKEVISTNQFIWLLFCIITAHATLHVPRLLILQAGRDAWLSLLFAWFLDVLLAIVYAYMGVRFPGQNMVQYSITILGKAAGSIVGFQFIALFLFISGALQKGLSLVLKKAFFPDIPIEIILISAFIVIGYGALKGVEAIGRVCEILGPIYLISPIVLFLFLLPEVKIDYLKPQLESGFYPAISGTPVILSFIGICIIMGMFQPICNKIENAFIAKFTAVSLGVSVTIMIVMGAIGVFGLPQAQNMITTSLELARYIHIGGFFQRIEAIWMMIAIGATIVTSAVLIWAFSLGLSQILKLKTYKPLVIPSTLISFAIALTSPNNSVELTNFVFYTLPIMEIYVETGLEMLLFFAALITRKRG